MRIALKLIVFMVLAYIPMSGGVHAQDAKQYPIDGSMEVQTFSIAPSDLVVFDSLPDEGKRAIEGAIALQLRALADGATAGGGSGQKCEWWINPSGEDGWAECTTCEDGDCCTCRIYVPPSQSDAHGCNGSLCPQPNGSVGLNDIGFSQ